MKMNRLSEQTFSRRRYTDNQIGAAKKINIATIEKQHRSKPREDFLMPSGRKNPIANRDMGFEYSGLNIPHG